MVLTDLNKLISQTEGFALMFTAMLFFFRRGGLDAIEHFIAIHAVDTGKPKWYDLLTGVVTAKPHSGYFLP